MQEAGSQAADKYGFEITSLTPFKDAYILNTPAGRKLLKKSLLSPERLLFVHGAKEHLFKNGFANTDRYLCTKDGLPYFEVGSDIYTLTDFIEGNECNFGDRGDIMLASRILANLHKASRGYAPPQNCIPRDDLGKLPFFYQKRLEEIKKLTKVAKKGRSKFDYMFLDCVDYFYSEGEEAISHFPDSRYGELVKAARQERGFCHHDYTHHNIVVSGSGITVVNFDFCCFELKAYDLANLLRRKMRKCNWDINEAGIIINEYRSIESLSSDEFILMKLMLQFPHKFWRIINKYYNSKRSWSERSFIIRLQEVIEESTYHRQFLSRFDSLA